MGVTISQLPPADPLTGAEVVPVVQNGSTRQASVAAVTASVSSTLLPNVVIIGDSHAAQSPMLPHFWPNLLQALLVEAGANVTVVDLAHGGYGFHDTNVNTPYNGKTIPQKCVSLNPVLVIVALGANDALFQAYTTDDIKIDAGGLFGYLRATLPQAKIVYGRELVYDDYHYPNPGTTLANQGVIPALWNTTSIGGIFAGAYCPENLIQSVDPAYRTKLASWLSIDAYIRGLTPTQGVDGFLTINSFRLARLGGMGPDGLHPNEAGAMIHAAYVLQGLKNQSWIKTLFPDFNTEASDSTFDPDAFFLSVLSSGVSNWTLTNTFSSVEENMTRANGPFCRLDPVNWYYPFKTSFYFTPSPSATVTHDASSTILIGASGGPPSQSVYYSDNSGAWGLLSVTSDYKGNWQNLTNGAALSQGSHVYRYKVGGGAFTEIYGPVSLTVSASSGGGGGSLPAFFAFARNSVQYSTDYITFDSTLTNQGFGVWDGIALHVTLPGVYLVSSTVTFYPRVNLARNGFLSINSSTFGNFPGANVYTQADTPGPYLGLTVTVPITCIAGEVLQVFATLSTYGLNVEFNNNTYPTWFSATYLHA